MKPLLLSLPATVIAAVALSTALTYQYKPHINEYAATVRCQPAAERSVLSADIPADPRDYVTRDLSGPPTFGACNVPTRPLTWLAARPLRFDGHTTVSVEFYLAAAEPEVNSAVNGYLFDGNRNLGAFTNTQTMNLQGGARNATSQYGRVYLTPARGIHRFRVVLAAVRGTSNPIYSGRTNLGNDPHRWPWWVAVQDWAPSYLRIAPA